MLPEPCILRREGGILPAELIKAALDLIPVGPDAPCNSIGDGELCEIAAGISLYIHWGPVGIHSDDAGMTYGYILKGREKGTGRFELYIDDGTCAKNEPKPIGYLHSDSAFIINSNRDHEVDTDDGDLLIFLAQDFGNDCPRKPGPEASNRKIDRWISAPHEPKTPPLTLDEWLDNLPGLFEAWLDHARTAKLSPFREG